MLWVAAVIVLSWCSSDAYNLYYVQVNDSMLPNKDYIMFADDKEEVVWVRVKEWIDKHSWHGPYKERCKVNNFISRVPLSKPMLNNVPSFFFWYNEKYSWLAPCSQSACPLHSRWKGSAWEKSEWEGKKKDIKTRYASQVSDTHYHRCIWLWAELSWTLNNNILRTLGDGHSTSAVTGCLPLVT